MGTTLDFVGQQVWNGAILLSDFIIHQHIINNSQIIRPKKTVILEIGAEIYVTDVGKVTSEDNDSELDDFEETNKEIDSGLTEDLPVLDVNNLHQDAPSRSSEKPETSVGTLSNTVKRKLSLSPKRFPHKLQRINKSETPVLDLLHHNVLINSETDTDTSTSFTTPIHVRSLDLKSDTPFQVDVDEPNEYSWTASDYLSSAENTERQSDSPNLIILAADIVYDTSLTFNFVYHMTKLLSIRSSTSLYLAIEKRINFTLDSKVTAPMYDYLFEVIDAWNDNVEGFWNAESEDGEDVPDDLRMAMKKINVVQVDVDEIPCCIEGALPPAVRHVIVLDVTVSARTVCLQETAARIVCHQADIAEGDRRQATAARMFHQEDIAKVDLEWYDREYENYDRRPTKIPEKYQVTFKDIESYRQRVYPDFRNTASASKSNAGARLQLKDFSNQQDANSNLQSDQEIKNKLSTEESFSTLDSETIVVSNKRKLSESSSRSPSPNQAPHKLQRIPTSQTPILDLLHYNVSENTTQTPIHVRSIDLKDFKVEETDPNIYSWTLQDYFANAKTCPPSDPRHVIILASDIVIESNLSWIFAKDITRLLATEFRRQFIW
ncbi:Methyltransferase-like protein 22 [Nowakowskiella sp. JEL0407]|nr:Methyltransferase-like protein 22 [Nowakowskiella sp. JEL0407]